MGVDLLNLIGPLISTAGGAVSAAENIDVAKQNQQQAQLAEAQRNDQYNKLDDLVSNPSKLLANIMAMKKQLTDAEKDQIVQSVTSRLVSQGQGGAPGLIQEAVDYALTQADNQLFQQAAQSYLGALGLPASVLRQQPIASLLPTSGAATGSFGPAVSGLSSIIAKLAKPSTPGLSGESAGNQAAYGSQDIFTGMDLLPNDFSTASTTPAPADASGG